MRRISAGRMQIATKDIELKTRTVKQVTKDTFQIVNFSVGLGEIFALRNSEWKRTRPQKVSLITQRVPFDRATL